MKVDLEVLEWEVESDDSSDCFVADDEVTMRKLIVNPRTTKLTTMAVGDDSTDIIDRSPVAINQIIEPTARLSMHRSYSQSEFTSVKRRSLTTYKPGGFNQRQMQRKLLPVKVRDKGDAEFDQRLIGFGVI